MNENRIKKSAKTFRLSKAALEQLDKLLEKEIDLSQRYGYKPKSMTDLVEEAINLLFIKELNPASDDAVFSRFSEIVDDKLRLALQGVGKSLNHILYENLKCNEYWNVLMQSSVTGNLSETRIRDLVHRENSFNQEIEEKLLNTFKKI